MHRMIRRIVSIFICFTATCFPMVSQSANKALLIGTTHYASERNNLPGIALDLAEMERVARKLGFESKNIKTLTGEAVTYSGIEAQFSGFLNDGVAPSDTILVYYSGHGVQVEDKSGDEDDGKDEALSLYDLEGISNNGIVSWDGVLIDDVLAKWLNSLVSENVIVIVDACHSGTVTRSYTGTTPAKTRAYGTEEFAIKSLGSPVVASRSLTSEVSTVLDEVSSGVITLSAAQDHQEALASKKGSLFTLALSESLELQRGTASPASLVNAASELLDSRLDSSLVYQPNLTGDEALFSKPITLTSATERGEVNQADLIELASAVSELGVVPTKKKYLVDERIAFTVDVPTTGYLNIVAVDDNDEMVVLFPNGVDTDNRVSAGEQALPGDRAFEWAAQPPWGNNMVTVLFSQSQFSLFDSSLQRDASGEADADYVLPSLAGFEQFREASGAKAAGVIFMKTCQSEGTC